QAQWVFGMIERNSKKCVLLPVPDRSANTLIPLINQYILPGSTIISDCWTSYNRIEENDTFSHLTVNHSYNFLNPEDNLIHTQNIENCWLHAKNKLKRQYGTRREMLEGYLYEFMFKRKYEKNKRLKQLIIILRTVFR
ncbi:hypothetical protein H312_02271, partial [Anncaliia algerae PRA339]